MKKIGRSGFTLLETLAMLACLFILVWLCFGLWRKANRPPKVIETPANVEKVETAEIPPANSAPAPAPAKTP
jgi:hypothetical protein